MPNKEGSDDEKKSTKSVVNKRQKQMMGEEGYDIARDMGKVSPSKDKKDATTMPVSDEVKKTQKKSKGKSAVELVKAKYGKSVMNVGKKKANEELDLSKVAEAFGGYIVEAPTKKPSYEFSRELGPKGRYQTKNIVKRSLKAFPPEGQKLGSQEDPEVEKQILSARMDKGAMQQAGKDQIDDLSKRSLGDTQPRQTLSPRGKKRLSKISQSSKIGDNTVSDFKKKLEKLKNVEVEGDNERGARRRAERDPKIAAMTSGQKERNIKQIKKDIDDKNPTIDTEVGKVPYRNRRVPKTRSLVPQYDRTPDIMKPDTDKLLKFPEFEKKRKTTTVGIDKDQKFTAPDVPNPPKPKKSLEEPKNKIVDKEPKTQGQGGGGGKGPRVTTSGGETFSGGGGNGAYSTIKKFAKKNPAAALAGYDLGKGILGKIMKARVPNVPTPRAIRVSAKS